MASKKRKIALLRGINVGGKNVIRMAELRSSLEDAGLSDVSTLIQSGNICFESSRACKGLEKLIHDTIQQDFGFEVPVLVREQSAIQAVIAKSPFCVKGQPKFDIKHLHVTLLGKEPLAKSIKAFAELDFDDEYVIAGDVVYLNLPSGYSKTKLTNGFLEKKLNVPATTRNWKTFCKVAEM
jgi:uncharacterized protein (DUF1697 family)